MPEAEKGTKMLSDEGIRQLQELSKHDKKISEAKEEVVEAVKEWINATPKDDKRLLTELVIAAVKLEELEANAVKEREEMEKNL